MEEIIIKLHPMEYAVLKDALSRHIRESAGCRNLIEWESHIISKCMMERLLAEEE